MICNKVYRKVILLRTLGAVFYFIFVIHRATLNVADFRSFAAYGIRKKQL